MIEIYPLCHLAVPLLLFEIPRIKERFNVNRLALIIGSLYPDIIDKSIHLITKVTGIMYCHNFLFVFLSFLGVHLIAKGKKQISIPFLIGAMIHLGLDMPSIPIFSPFISYNYTVIDQPVEYYVSKYFNNLFIITTELISGIVLLFLILKNKLYHYDRLKEYLIPKMRMDEDQTVTKRMEHVDVRK